MTTLESIRTKARRLSASPSPMQITDVQIDEYINTFYLHDLPARLKLFDLNETCSLYLQPNIDRYNLNTDPSFTAVTPRAYYSVEPPVYVSGTQAYYTQSDSEFYSLFPKINTEDTQMGDGTAGAYLINITNTPVLRNNVTISVTDAGGNNFVVYDNGAGVLVGDVTVGAINYITGVGAVTFTGNIPATETITVQSVPYSSGKPSAVLFKNNMFFVRPVPNKGYRMDIDAYFYPTALLNAADSPETQSLWQLLAIGAAKKILEDRGDMQGVQSLMPLFDEQMCLCQRRTMQQNRPVRAATIYCNQFEVV